MSFQSFTRGGFSHFGMDSRHPGEHQDFVVTGQHLINQEQAEIKKTLTRYGNSSIMSSYKPHRNESGLKRAHSSSQGSAKDGTVLEFKDAMSRFMDSDHNSERSFQANKVNAPMKRERTYSQD